MNNEQKICEIYQLITNKTMPKDQLGFYTENDLVDDITKIVNG